MLLLAYYRHFFVDFGNGQLLLVDSLHRLLN